MPDQRSQLEATFLSRLQPKAPPDVAAAPAADQGELAGRRRDPSLFSLLLDRIRPDADQVRRSGKDSADPAVRELADSIRSVGVLQPLDVRYITGGDYYEIVAGERRYTAATLAGLREVPVKLLETTEAEVRRLQLLENIHRQDLSPLEVGSALLELSSEGATPEDLSKLLSKGKSYVAKALGVARNLSADAKNIVRQAPDSFRSMAHLYEVSLLPQEGQAAVLRRVAERGLTREQLQAVTAELKRMAAAHRPTKGGRPRKSTSFTRTIALVGATVTVRITRADATEDEVAAVLRAALESLG